MSIPDERRYQTNPRYSAIFKPLTPPKRSENGEKIKTRYISSHRACLNGSKMAETEWSSLRRAARIGNRSELADEVEARGDGLVTRLPLRGADLVAVLVNEL